MNVLMVKQCYMNNQIQQLSKYTIYNETVSMKHCGSPFYDMLQILFNNIPMFPPTSYKHHLKLAPNP